MANEGGRRTPVVMLEAGERSASHGFCFIGGGIAWVLCDGHPRDRGRPHPRLKLSEKQSIAPTSSFESTFEIF
jgi:hypothetical protein